MNCDSNLIHRWVDEKCAGVYLRHNTMVARHRHTLPEEIAGSTRPITRKGLSFGLGDANKWNAYGRVGVCFTVDRSRLGNVIYDIASQPIFSFGSAHKARHLSGDWEGLAQLRRAAIEESRDEPDEAFVLGNIRPLHEVLVHIEAKDGVSSQTRESIAKYLEQNPLLQR